MDGLKMGKKPRPQGIGIEGHNFFFIYYNLSTKKKMFSDDNSAMIVLAIVLGALALWYMLGHETCEGCQHECRMEGYSDVECSKRCASRGLTCAMDINPPTLSPSQQKVYFSCMKKCAESLDPRPAGCEKACRARAEESSESHNPGGPPPPSMGKSIFDGEYDDAADVY
jgi:hypothetical protein